MSAATENLLSQIEMTELMIQEKKRQGQEVSQLEEQLVALKEQLHSLNENLGAGAKILRG